MINGRAERAFLLLHMRRRRRWRRGCLFMVARLVRRLCVIVSGDFLYDAYSPIQSGILIPCPMCDERIQLSINHLNFFQFSPNSREIRWFQDIFCDSIHPNPFHILHREPTLLFAGRKGPTDADKFNWEFTSCKIKTGINPNALHMWLRSYKGKSNENYTRQHNFGLFSIIAIQHSCNNPNANLFFIMWILEKCSAARGMTRAGILK